MIGRGRTLLLLGTVFASGTAVMIVEMTAVRAIQPFFGSTNFVWTNVIAVVLAALAVGYSLGGRLADRRPSPGLLYAIMASGGGLLLLCAGLVTPVSRLFLTDGVHLQGVVSVLVRGSLGATLILFAPPILLLGMISPMAIRLLSEGGVGRAAGRVFAVSTVGSILGTYLPTLWLVPAVGSRGSILIAAAVLIGAAAVGLLGFRRFRGAAVTTVLLVVAIAGGAGGSLEPARGAPSFGASGSSTVLVEVESPYQFLTVRDDVYEDGSVVRGLTINEGVYSYHSARVEGRVLTGSRHYDDYTVLPLLLDLEPGAELDGLIVGMACGVNASQWKHFWGDVYRLRVDGAEIDPGVVALGREYFGLPGPESDWLRTFPMDGRQLLRVLPEEQRYHLVVVDAFANEIYIPFHLGTREFFELCRRRLQPGGVLAMNVYAVGEDAPNLLALENTLATVFGHVVRARQHGGWNFQLLARNGDAPPEMERLAPARVRERFSMWPGYQTWSGIPEWEGLLALGERFIEDVRVVEPVAEGWILTDDRAPLEYLTDRFLERLEERVLADDGSGRGRLHHLARRQTSLLLVVGMAWVVVLGLGLLALRATGSEYATPETRPAASVKETGQPCPPTTPNPEP
jgi:hypothetical protein